MKQLHFLFLFCFGFLLSASGQQNPVRFQHLTVNDGLSQGHILCMLQDKEGYIWIGTYNGLNRYNSYNFDHFYADQSDPNSLTINVIFSIFEDRQGKIWCGTWGIDVYDPEAGSFTKHIPAEKGPNSISAGEVSSIEEDNNGIMWFGTRSGGLNKYDPSNGKITWFKADSLNKEALHSNNINDIHFDRKGYLWIATEDGGLSKLCIKDEHFTTYSHSDSDCGSIPSNTVTSIFEDREGTLWFGDNNGVLSKYDREKNQFSKVYQCQLSGEDKKVRIMKIAQSYDGGLLLATNGMGLVKYDPRLKMQLVFLHNSLDAESLISNETWSVLVSRSKSVFIGSYGRGISVYSPFSNKFMVFSIKEPNLQGKETNAFTDAVEDHLGHLIVGSYDGFKVYDKKTWTYQHYLPGNSYIENKILTIALAPDSTIWLSSENILFRYDYNFKKIASYVFDPDIKSQAIYSILFDSRDNLWIGLFDKGLIKIQPGEWRNRKVAKLKYHLYPFVANDTLSPSGSQDWIIFEDSHSDLWIGGVGGLDKYNYSNDNFTRVFYPGTVKTIDEDKNGNLWLGTIGNGLICFNPEKHTNRIFTTQDGLKNSFIYGVLTDDIDNVWITSEGGLDRLHIPTNEIRNYDKRDGLPDDHFDDKSESKLEDGRFYLGTNNGFVIFRPGDITDDTSTVKLFLTRLVIDNKLYFNYTDSRSDSLRKIPVSRLTRIDLLPNQRDIEFRYAALYYNSPYKIRYRCQLKGYDNGWINTSSSKRSARYTNLEGGKYTFLVQATNGEGKWCGNTLEIELVVHPPFYKTIALKILVFLLILVMLVTYFRYRLVREKNRNINLSVKVEEATREIREKNEQLEAIAENLKQSNSRLKENQELIVRQSEEIKKQMDELASSNATKDKLFSVIGHDLRGPFNVILGYSELLISGIGSWSKEKQLVALNLLNDSAEGAHRLLENLLQWSQSKSGDIRFNPEDKSISEIVNLALADVELFAKKKEIQFINHAANNQSVIRSDVNMLNTILRNLIMNAIKYSHRGGKVEIGVIPAEGNFMLFNIKDEGVGMAQEAAENLFSPGSNYQVQGTEGEKGTGIGLLLCREFVEYHHGKIWVQSEADAGTTIFFTIPTSPESF